MNQAALGKCHAAENRSGMKQQHRGGACEPCGVGLMRGSRGQDPAISAHHARECNQDAMHAHQLRSSINRTMAARNSGMPMPERDEVVSTSGKAAGCLA